MTPYELNAELIRLRDDHKSLHAVVLSLQGDVARLQEQVAVLLGVPALLPMLRRGEAVHGVARRRDGGWCIVVTEEGVAGHKRYDIDEHDRDAWQARSVGTEATR